MKIIFAGTPDFSVPALDRLAAAGHDIVTVLTQPDRKAGRGRKLRPGPVKQAARDLGLKVLQPTSLRNGDIAETLAELAPDIMVVVAYGLILPEHILAIPRHGCLNIHASLLPRWRGAAPIQRAIEHGDDETGITIMQMDAGLDTGDILARYPVPITADETGRSLHDKLATLGGKAIVEVLDDLPRFQRQAVAQDEAQATYAAKLTRDESITDWSAPAEDIERRIRAFNPWPLTRTWLKDMPLNLYEARLEPAGDVDAPPGTVMSADADGIRVQAGDGIVRITRLQRPGGRPLPVADFLNGVAIQPGSRFGPPPA